MVKTDLLSQKYLVKTIALISGVFFLLTSCNGHATGTAGSKNSSSAQDAIGDTVKEPGKNIMVIYQDKKNNYWFGSWEDGLYYYNGKTILHITKKNGLPNNRVEEIREDRFGNLFFNTPDGISKFDGQKFTLLAETNNLVNEWILNPDDLWFKSFKYPGQVIRYDGISLYRLQIPKTKIGEEYLSSHPTAPNPYAVYCVYNDSMGNIWFGTAVLGACRYNGKSFDWISEEDVTELHDGPSNGVRSIIEDKSGYFWFNTQYRYDIYGNTKTSDTFYNREKSIGSLDGKADGNLNEYLSIVQDNKGGLWISTYDTGVWQYDGKSITHYPVNYNGKDIHLFSICKDNAGVLWLGTQSNGAFKFNGEKFEKF